MPDRTFIAWLTQTWVRSLALILTFAFVWIFFMLGLASSLRQNQAVDRSEAEHAQITKEATRAAKESVETRKAVERIETLLRVEGIGP